MTLNNLNKCVCKSGQPQLPNQSMPCAKTITIGTDALYQADECTACFDLRGLISSIRIEYGDLISAKDGGKLWDIKIQFLHKRMLNHTVYKDKPRHDPRAIFSDYHMFPNVALLVDLQTTKLLELIEAVEDGRALDYCRAIGGLSGPLPYAPDFGSLGFD